MQDRPVAISGSIVGVHTNRLIIVGKCFDRIAFLGVHRTTRQIVHRIFGMGRHQFIKHLFGLLKIFFLNIGYCHIHQHLAVFRLKLQTFPVVFYCFVKFLLTLTGNTTCVICLYQERVPFKTKRTVFFSSFIIIQIDFCHSTVEIWFGQPRFWFDNLIEILYRKNIVLKIQGVAPDSQHTIRIDLCKHG